MIEEFMDGVDQSKLNKNKGGTTQLSSSRRSIDDDVDFCIKKGIKKKMKTMNFKNS